jgi:hypothetical protein
VNWIRIGWKLREICCLVCFVMVFLTLPKGEGRLFGWAVALDAGVEGLTLQFVLPGSVLGLAVRRHCVDAASTRGRQGGGVVMIFGGVLISRDGQVGW